MSTSWKEVCNKLKMNGMMRQIGSDDSQSIASGTSDFDSVTNSSTPQMRRNSRSSFDNEWQMNYMIINRRDGL